jgi:eukaryotic-like serine/threonine-protein kinase
VRAPVIADKYTLLRRLGAGGMAEVFLAKQDGQGGFEKLVVVKRILPGLVENPEFLKMFLDEARLAADLRHPNIVNIYDVSQDRGTHFILMEFLHGQDVRRLQRKNAQWGEMIPVGQACQIVLDAAAGLHYAHKKSDFDGRPLSIVHRDVSPQNIIITYEGSTKIVDFGIAKAAGQSTHTQTGILKGKYTYMSPEQARGDKIDHRTDQYALGIVFWELLTMRRLFKRESEVLTLEAIISGNVPKPRRFVPDLPPKVEEIVMTALATDPDDRFADCEEMMTAIEEFLAQASIVHSPARLGQYMRRMFADALAEEASLGLVRPDGSIAASDSRYSLPEPDPPPKKPKEEAPVDQTAADRKSVRDVRSKESKPKEEPATRVESRGGQKRPAPPPPPPAAVKTLSDSRRRKQPTHDDEELSLERLKPTLVVAAGALVVAITGAGIALAASAWMKGGTGHVVVRSDPRGAVVVLDGRPTGQTTPALLKDVPAGVPHLIRVEAPGKEPADATFTIPARGETVELMLTIPK